MQVLMRALRDFNLPKIVTEDITVFMGLIEDLFPGMDLPRARDVEFEKVELQHCAHIPIRLISIRL